MAGYSGSACATVRSFPQIANLQPVHNSLKAYPGVGSYEVLTGERRRSPAGRVMDRQWQSGRGCQLRVSIYLANPV